MEMESKTEILKFRVTTKERQVIEYAAKRKKMTVSEYMRVKTFEKPTVSSLEQAPDIAASLVRLQDLLNQASLEAKSKEKIVKELKTLWQLLI